MSTTSPYIKMTLQALDENPDTWGNVLNVSALELLEDAISGTATANVEIGSVALAEDAGADNPPHYRMMIVNIVGAPGAARNVTCPPISQVYLVANSTTGGQTITFKTTAGTGVVIGEGDAIWCYCDGTNIIATTAANAATAELATLATNSNQLGGIAAANYAQLAVNQEWTAGQYVARDVLSTAGNVITPDLTGSNSFYAILTAGQSVQLQAPSNPQNGQTFTLVVQQHAVTPGTISYATNTYIWEAGAAPTLTAVAGAVDYFGFEYCSNIVTTGGRWIGAAIKNIGPIT